jgi:hypothetical protein
LIVLAHSQATPSPRQSSFESVIVCFAGLRCARIHWGLSSWSLSLVGVSKREPVAS